MISVTGFEAGNAYNVIPRARALRGTVRTFRTETMAAAGAADAGARRQHRDGFGATAELDFRELSAPLVNSPERPRCIADAAAAMVGEPNVDRAATPPWASEDFSYMLEERPGAYILVGNGDGAGSCQVHNPGYDFNDAAIPYGAGILAAVVEKELPGKPARSQHPARRRVFPLPPERRR